MLIEALRDFGSSGELLAAHPNVTRRHVDLAQAYAAEYPDEIEAAIADNRRPLAERRGLYPLTEASFVD
jgi:hypothetical protein